MLLWLYLIYRVWKKARVLSNQLNYAVLPTDVATSLPSHSTETLPISYRTMALHDRPRNEVVLSTKKLTVPPLSNNYQSTPLPDLFNVNM